MGKKNTIIEINGQRYDASSGSLIGPAAAAHKPQKLQSKHLNEVVRTPAKHAGAHQPKTSQTLMRHAVKKPAGGARRPKAHGHTDQLASQPLSEIMLKPSAKRVDGHRLAKARRINQSQAISHFGELSDTALQIRLRAAQQATAAKAKPVKRSYQAHSIPAQRSTSELLERAIERSTSHEQTFAAPPVAKHSKRHRRTRWAISGGAAVLLVVIIAVVASHNAPNIQLQLASARAGFAANLPDNQPTGFELQNFGSSKGVVAVDFRSTDDSSSYRLIQKPSNWDSLALRDLYVKTVDANYQLIQTGGRTIYLYGENATWISDGVWYTIQNNGALSKLELIKLATSL